MKKFRFFLQKTVFALCLFAAGGRVLSAEAKKWTLAAEAFTFTQKNAETPALKAAASAIPSIMLEQITKNMNRMPRAQEQLDRKLYELQKDRLSLFLQLSNEVRMRDSIFLNGYSKRKTAYEIKKQNTKIADIQKKIDENLKTAAKEEAHFEAQIQADIERQKRLEEGDVINDEQKKENALIVLFKDLAKKRKVQEPVLEEVVIYQNDFSKLFAAPEETRAKGYASFEFEKSCVDGGIQGLITGKITVYGSYLSAAVTLYEYPGAREIGHATDVGGVDEIGFIAKRLASSLIPKISDSMPVELRVSVKPEDAAAKPVLTVDDSVFRSIPETLTFGSGVHTLSFEAEGYASASISYSFTGNRRFSVEIEMREKKDGVFTLALKKDFAGDLFADGELAATLKAEERFASIKINDGNILGRFISEDGSGADYFIKDSLVEDGAKLVINAKPFDRSKYIEKRRKWMYSSYSALIVSLIPTFYCYGNYFSSASAYNKCYDFSYDEAVKWQTAYNVTSGISIACGVFFTYELTRYLLAANTVLPAEAKKRNPRREAKIRAQEEKARALAENADSEKKENTEELNTEESEISAPEKTEAAGD
ncbi:MAG: hypothetical protein ACTTGZ_08915 [Treponema sp.]